MNCPYQIDSLMVWWIPETPSHTPLAVLGRRVAGVCSSQPLLRDERSRDEKRWWIDVHGQDDQMLALKNILAWNDVKD